MRSQARSLLSKAARGLESSEGKARAMLENMLATPSSSGRVVVNQTRLYHKNVRKDSSTATFSDAWVEKWNAVW
ncbi:MAG: hypothetical protein ABGY24_13785 [bacterium]|jgi:hypothetical protein